MGKLIQDLVKNKEDALEAEKAAIVHCGNLPVLHRHNTKLSEIQETIVKAIYLVGGMYASDIKMMLSFSSEIQSVERAIKDLINDGYIIKNKNAYGILLGLTKEGVSQIKMHPDYIPEGLEVNCQEMDVFGESALLKHKCMSYAASEYVFYERLNDLWNKFWGTDKYERNYYLCKQYLKQIVYRDFLTMGKEEKEQFLMDADFTDDEKELFVRNDKYVVWNATKFSELLFIHKGFEGIKSTESYHEYMQIIKRDALKQPNFNTFYLLKDMISDDNRKPYQELKLLWKWRTSMLKFGVDKLRTGIKGNTDLITKEKKLDSCNRCLSIFQNERRSIINKNAYRKKTDEKELGEALVALAELDYAIQGVRKEKDELESDFSFAVLKSYDGAENDYEIKILTLQRLIQNGIFLWAKNENEIVLSIMQTNEEYFDLFSLHKKMSMGLQFIKRLSPYISVDVRIYTYSTDQQEQIERVMPALIKKLLESRETAFFANLLNDICTIHRASDGLKERYIFFQNVKKEMEGDYIDEKERSNGASENEGY